MLALAISYVAGALSTLSPCVLPLLPVILIGALQQHAWAPLALAAGLSTSFALVGTAIALAGFSVDVDPVLIRGIIAAFIAATGLVLLVPALQGRVASAAAPLATAGQSVLGRLRPNGIGGQFVIGVLLGAIWSPCAGPTLGAAIGLAAESATAPKALAVMAAFSLGATTPILALAYGSRQAIASRGGVMARVSRIAKPVVGATLVAVGALVLTGLDKVVEASLTRAMPEWLVAVTTRL